MLWFFFGLVVEECRPGSRARAGSRLLFCWCFFELAVQSVVQRVVLVLSYLGSAFVLLRGLILVWLAILGKRRIFGNARCFVSPARGPEREGIRWSLGRIAAHGDWIQLALTGARVRTA